MLFPLASNDHMQDIVLPKPTNKGSDCPEMKRWKKFPLLTPWCGSTVSKGAYGG